MTNALMLPPANYTSGQNGYSDVYYKLYAASQNPVNVSDADQPILLQNGWEYFFSWGISNQPISGFTLTRYAAPPSGQLFAPPYATGGAGVTNLYVDSINGSDSNNGSVKAPFASITKAASYISSLVNNNGRTPLIGAAAGYVVNVMPGAYPCMPPAGQRTNLGTNINSLILDTGGNSNAPNGYVVYRSVIPYAAKIIPGAGSSTDGTLVRITAPYIIIDGFDIDGQTLVNNVVAYDRSLVGQYANPNFYNSQGVAHHIICINNKVHDGLAAGLGFNNIDYLLLAGNEVYNCATMSTTNTSGISLYQAQAQTPGALTTYDTVVSSSPLCFAQYRIKVLGNICYNNTLRYSATATGHTHSDGNGIILDDFLNTQASGYQTAAYPYNGLIQGNLCYNNGGAGIACYYSQNMTINSNTSLGNWQDPQNNSPELPNAEIYVYASKNTSVTNNIMVAANAPSGGVPGGNFAFFVNSIQGSGSQAPSTSGNVVYPAITIAQYTDPNAAADFAAFVSNNANGLNPNIQAGLIPSTGVFSIGTGAEIGA